MLDLPAERGPRGRGAADPRQVVYLVASAAPLPDLFQAAYAPGEPS